MTRTEIVCFILIKSQGVLLVKRHSSESLAGKVVFPAGTLNQNDYHRANPLASALKREMSEELGVFPQKYKFISSVEFQSEEREELVHIFLVSKWKGKVKNIQSHEGRIMWVSIEEAFRILSFEEAKKALKDSLKKSI